MALGGGTWVTQNKVLPGCYINFISLARATSMLSERGVAAMPVALDWGNGEGIQTVTADQFRRHALAMFGYAYDSAKMTALRDLFLNVREAHLFRINGKGVKALNAYGTAKYPGTRGNDITIVIAANANSTEEDPLYDVRTVLSGAVMEEQRGIETASDLVNNDFVTWNDSATLELTAGTPMIGGTNSTPAASDYRLFLDALESYAFHTLGVATTETSLKAMFAEYTKRMREEAGVKFQCVLYRYTEADHEGILSVENALEGENGTASDSAALVYWTVGAQAACAVNASLTNRTYDGGYAPFTQYTQAELEDGIKAGKFMFHRVGDEVRTLTDINTLVTYTDIKGKDFASNQTVRVLDQIGNDIAALFNDRYSGKVPNDKDGRISLWNDIVRHHQEMQGLRAIEDFEPSNVSVEQGETKTAVLVEDRITPVSAMAQMYMAVYVA